MSVPAQEGVIPLPGRSHFLRHMEESCPHTVLELLADNLKCEGWASTLRRKLSTIQGVRTLTVVPAATAIRGQHDGTMTSGEFRTELRSIGFPELGAGDFVDTTRPHLSYASGRLRG